MEVIHIPKNTQPSIYDPMPIFPIAESSEVYSTLVKDILKTIMQGMGLIKGPLIKKIRRTDGFRCDEEKEFIQKIHFIVKEVMPKVPKKIKDEILLSRMNSLIEELNPKDTKLNITKKFNEQCEEINKILKVFEKTVPLKKTYIPALAGFKKIYEANIQLYFNLFERVTVVDIEVDNRIKKEPKDVIPPELSEGVINSEDITADILELRLNSCRTRTKEFEARLKVLREELDVMVKSKNAYKNAYNKLLKKVVNNSTEYSLSDEIKKEEVKEEVKEEISNKIKAKIIDVAKLTEEQEKYVLDIFKQILIKNYYLTGEGLNIDPSTCLKSEDYKDDLFRSIHSFVISWNPCSNVKKTAEDLELKEEIKKLNTEMNEITTQFNDMLNSYLDKINTMASPLENVRNDVEDTRNEDIQTYTDITISKLNNLPDQIDQLENKIKNRISLGLKASITEQFISMISLCFDIEYFTLENYINYFNKNTEEFKNILNGKDVLIPTPTSCNDTLNQKIEELKYYFCYFSYLFEYRLRDTYLRRLYFASCWYGGYYNYIDEGKFEIPPDEQKKMKKIESKDI